MERNDEIRAGGIASLVDDEILGDFLSRQKDLLDEAEGMALDIERDAAGGAPAELLRYFHTVKGEAGLLGLDPVARVCHAVESRLQEARPGCTDKLLAATDWMRQTFDRIAATGNPLPADEILAALEDDGNAAGRGGTADPDAGPSDSAPGADGDPAAEPSGDFVCYGLDVRTGDIELLRDFLDESADHLAAAEDALLELEHDPRAAEPLNRVFRAFHTIKGVAGFTSMDHMTELAHRAEGLLDRARKGGLELVGERMDQVFGAVDAMHRLVDDAGRALKGDGRLERFEKLPALLAALGDFASSPRGDAAGDSAANAVPADGPAPRDVPDPETGGGLIVLNPLVSDAPAAKAAAPGAGGSVQVRKAVRVDAERLDNLVEALGELVIAEAMVSQSEELRRHVPAHLQRHLDKLDKISREMQEIGLSLRMMPVRSVFQKMHRLVRDLDRKTGRRVDFFTSGEDTELDRAVVDKIGDPLVHMIRNAVDHGIEADVEQRRRAGKPDRGRIELRARHQGGNICIEIEDDGAGLDRDAILAKAVERGLVPAGERPSDREIDNLIFEPGFSTAAEVTDVSGRGVGMDVVRRNIEDLRGSVVISSRPGRGTVFSIMLPLTLGIIDGMVVRVGTETYIVPTLAMVRLVRPEEGETATLMERDRMLSFAGELIPLLRLGEIFDAPGGSSARDEVAVVVEDGGRRVALLADELIGLQQIVIKSLGDSIQGTPGFAGGAILSDGRVAPILDVASLIRTAVAPQGAAPDA